MTGIKRWHDMHSFNRFSDIFGFNAQDAGDIAQLLRAIEPAGGKMKSESAVLIMRDSITRYR